MNGIRFVETAWSLLLLAGLGVSSAAAAEPAVQAAPQPLVIDATAEVPSPGSANYTGGSSVSPHGDSITLNSRYLLRNGKPWLPVMGEFHYSRVPRQRWEEELLKMKTGGVQIVSTYVFWIHHEEVEGQFDWSGQRDLRHFLELCAKHGLLVQLRIGPWAHGEARNGGFPDWLLTRVKSDDLRRNTTDYMTYVQRYYRQIGEQAQGLMWKDGGPIIGIQLENEYGQRGPHGGSEYILALKDLAQRSGFDVPLYIVTGWDNAVVPNDAVLPVFGGYPDAPWDGSTQQLPPSEVYAFRFHGRVAGDMGMMGKKSERTAGDERRAETPFMTAEMGGGMQNTYHRRLVIAPDDVAAMCPVMLGSGVNLYGTYMFQGGQNPDGKRTTLQESQSTAYPNDVPVKSYDFAAPLGEFGEERESFRKLKLLNYFLNDFGDRLAPLAARPPEIRPESPSDFSVPRLSVRTNGREGFLFWNNYVRYYPMPSWSGAQVTIRLPQQVLKIPREPVTIPSGAYFIWPFHLDLEGAELQYSTAQLFTKLTAGGSATYYFIAIPGIPAEFAFDSKTAVEVQEKRGHVVTENGVTYVIGLTPGITPSIVVRPPGGTEVRIVLLSKDEAESAWKAHIDGSEHLVFTSRQFYSDQAHLYLQSIGDAQFEFQVMPGLSHALQGTLPMHMVANAGGIGKITATAPQAKLDLRFAKTKEEGQVPPVKLGPAFSWRKNSVAQAPDDPDFEHAATWRVTVPPHFPSQLSEVFLRVNYVGDVARLSSQERLLEDDFYSGLPWSVGLDRFREELSTGQLQLQILPLRRDAPIFLETGSRPAFGAREQRDDLKSVTLVPEYQLTIDSGSN